MINMKQIKSDAQNNHKPHLAKPEIVNFVFKCILFKYKGIMSLPQTLIF